MNFTWDIGKLSFPGVGTYIVIVLVYVHIHVEPSCYILLYVEVSYESTFHFNEYLLYYISTFL